MSHAGKPFASVGLALWICLAFGLPRNCPPAFSASDRIDFPDRKYSVQLPAADWEVTGRSPSAASWTNRISKSVISVSGGELSPHSSPAIAQIFLSNTWMALEHRSQGKWSWKVTPIDQREVTLDGKTFYQVVANLEGSPKDGDRR